MSQSLALLVAGIALTCALILFFVVDKLPANRGGWVAVALVICAFPALATTTGTSYVVKSSSTTEFCMECHEMKDYGRTLFVDDRQVLPAVHYQKRLIDRERACFVCHTNYGMFGDMKAKMNGLKHVYVHFLGDVPEPGEFELYQPYPNSNCLHCHDDARSFIEAAPHQGQIDKMKSDEISCLQCHNKGHGHEQVEEGNLWLGQ